jgi:hypothetical protein
MPDAQAVMSSRHDRLIGDKPMGHPSGRDIQDFTLTMRDMAVLPWRLVTSDANGQPTQLRAAGPVQGKASEIVLAITYKADDDATLPGEIDYLLYTLTGPTGESAHTVKLVPVYDADGEQTGMDVELDGQSVPYTS